MSDSWEDSGWGWLKFEAMQGVVSLHKNYFFVGIPISRLGPRSCCCYGFFLYTSATVGHVMLGFLSFFCNVSIALFSSLGTHTHTHTKELMLAVVFLSQPGLRGKGRVVRGSGFRRVQSAFSVSFD